MKPSFFNPYFWIRWLVDTFVANKARTFHADAWTYRLSFSLHQDYQSSIQENKHFKLYFSLLFQFYVIIIWLFHGANIHIYFDWRAYAWKIICRVQTITNLPYHYASKIHGRFVIICVFSRKNSRKEIVIPTKVPHKLQTRLAPCTK